MSQPTVREPDVPMTPQLRRRSLVVAVFLTVSSCSWAYMAVWLMSWDALLFMTAVGATLITAPCAALMFWIATDSQ